MVRRLVVMVQREVGERLLASPGDEGYGPASTRVKLRATGELVRRVPPAVFWPRPAVESVVVRLARRDRPSVDVDERRLLEVVDAGFAERRKTMRNALRRLGVADAEVLASAGVDRRARRVAVARGLRADRGRPRGFARRSGPFERSLVTGLRMPAHAKLNVFLRVLGVRSTTATTTSRRDPPDAGPDDVMVRAAADPHRRGRGAGRRRAGRGRESRAPRGARAGRRGRRRPRGADHVTKRIPVAAGLGGARPTRPPSFACSTTCGRLGPAATSSPRSRSGSVRTSPRCSWAGPRTSGAAARSSSRSSRSRRAGSSRRCRSGSRRRTRTPGGTRGRRRAPIRAR